MRTLSDRGFRIFGGIGDGLARLVHRSADGKVSCDGPAARRGCGQRFLFGPDDVSDVDSEIGPGLFDNILVNGQYDRGRFSYVVDRGWMRGWRNRGIILHRSAVKRFELRRR